MLTDVAILAVGPRNAIEKLQVAQPNGSAAVVMASRLLAAEASVDCHTRQPSAGERASATSTAAAGTPPRS